MQISTQTAQSLRDAIKKLENAKEELQRPEEDVMAYSICTQVRQSLNGMLRSYLSYKEIELDEKASLDSLFEQCKAHCQDFSHFKISQFICNAVKPTDSNEGCLGPTHCMTFEEYTLKVTFATSIKEIVINEMRLSENDLK